MSDEPVKTYWEDLHDRLQTIADEAFGPFQCMTGNDLLTEIERGIHRDRRVAEADLATLRDTAGRYRAALVASRDLFKLLRGHVDVRLVPELYKLIASARAALAATPGTATTADRDPRACPRHPGKRCVDFDDNGNEKTFRCAFSCAIDNTSAKPEGGETT